MPSRVELAKDLDAKVAAQILAPAATRMAAAIADDVRMTGPIDTGVLRSLVTSTPAVVSGTLVAARYISSRPKGATIDEHGATTVPKGQDVDVAAFVEFGTRYMTPRRYSAKSARRVISKLGYGRFVESSSPWPHR